MHILRDMKPFSLLKVTSVLEKLCVCIYIYICIGFISVEREKSKKFVLDCKTPEHGGSELLPNVGNSLPLNKP